MPTKHDRRAFLTTALVNAGALAQTSPGSLKRRNIIFILTDDHRYDALGFLRGQSWLETPHLDAIAREGVHFRNAVVTTSLCSPSRASILTICSRCA